MTQIDPPAPPTESDVGGRWFVDADCEPNVNGGAPFGQEPDFGQMRVLGTGFYGPGTRCSNREMAQARAPYGCRILGQTTSQCATPTDCTSVANRFGASVSVSGNFLMVSAPLRTVRRTDVPTLPTLTRFESGSIYMLQLKRPGAPANQFPYRLPRAWKRNWEAKTSPSRARITTLSKMLVTPAAMEQKTLCWASARGTCNLRCPGRSTLLGRPGGPGGRGHRLLRSEQRRCG
jgi:hypothetical protein